MSRNTLWNFLVCYTFIETFLKAAGREREIFLEGRPKEHPLECSPKPTFFDWIPGREINQNNFPLENTELCPLVDLPQRNAIRSQHRGQFTRAHFVNDSGRKVQLYYVSEDGKLIPVATLIAGESVSIDTMEGHVFIAIENKSGRMLLRHTVGLFYFGNSADSESVVCSDDQFRPLRFHEGPPLECGSIAKGFVNLSKCKINVFYFNGKNEELVAQLDPIYGSASSFAMKYHYEDIYLTHQFFARLPNGKLLQEKKVDRISIPSCDSHGIQVVSTENIPQQQLTFKTVVRKVGTTEAFCSNILIDNNVTFVTDFITDFSKEYENCKSNFPNITTTSRLTGQANNTANFLTSYVPPLVLDLSRYTDVGSAQILHTIGSHQKD